VTLRVVGAGLGRTGTASLKAALERLLGEPCYHMREVFGHPEHVPTWHAAARGDLPDWSLFLEGYAAAVDWPAVSFWPELSTAFPHAVVLLSTRDPESWFGSVEATIMPEIHASFSGSIEGLEEWSAMIRDLFTSRFTSSFERDDWIREFEAHNARVRAAVPAGRLVEWQASDGWKPLCDALDVPVPDQPFPWENKSKNSGGS